MIALPRRRKIRTKKKRVTQTVKHGSQKAFWEEEHRHHTLLPQIDSQRPSSGITRLWSWLRRNHVRPRNVLEICCGKGRNAIWLAKKNIQVTGFDFSKTAITVAMTRAQQQRVTEKCNFFVHDALQSWPLGDGMFDLVLNIFGISEIESSAGRSFAAREAMRVLQPGGRLLTYTHSSADQFCKELRRTRPARQQTSYVYPTGMVGTFFAQQEVLRLYAPLHLVTAIKVYRQDVFLGKKYAVVHHWMLFQK